METTRGELLQARLDAIGISHLEFSKRADSDRGTISRAVSNDPTVTERTWRKLEAAAQTLEEVLGMAEGGNLVTSTIEYRGAKITLQASPAATAETVRRMMDSQGDD